MVEDVLSALELPPACRVDKRVPKKLLLEHGAPTASDRKCITNDIEDMHWVAALKPNTIGVPAYRDEERAYLEIAILRLTLRPDAKATRLIELLHRAIPYPTLLITSLAGAHQISCANIRWAQNEADKTVLDGDVMAVSSADPYDPACWQAFFAALGLTRQPRTSMRSLYLGWTDCLISLKASAVTARFIRAEHTGAIERRHLALAEYQQLSGEIAGLRNAAAKEKQMPKLVDLNLRMKRLETQRAAIVANL
jgi:hypothetical protein